MIWNQTLTDPPAFLFDFLSAKQASKKKVIRAIKVPGGKIVEEKSSEIELTEKEVAETEAAQEAIQAVLDSVAMHRGEEPIIQRMPPPKTTGLDLEKTPSEAEKAQRSEAERERSADKELNEFITATLSEGAEQAEGSEGRRDRRGEGRTEGSGSRPRLPIQAKRAEGRGSEEATSEFVALERTSTTSRAQEIPLTRQLSARTEGVYPSRPSVVSGGPQGSGAEARLKGPAEESVPFSLEQIECIRKMTLRLMEDTLAGGEAMDSFARKVAETLTGHKVIFEKQKGLSTQMDGLKEGVSEVKKFLPTMMGIGKDQEQIKQSFRDWEDDVKNRASEVADLHTDMAKVAAEYEAVKNESLSLGKAISDFKDSMLLEVRGLAARVEGLEDFRRSTWQSQGKEDTVDSNRLRREGFDFGMEAIISRGGFPRRLLDDSTFMDLIQDKDGFIFRIEKAERERRGRSDDRGPYDRGQGSQSHLPQGRYPSDRR